MDKKTADSSLDACWLRFREELDARIVARFALAPEAPASEPADPEILADLALQRALMS